jgi:hypothetical protein
MKRKLGAGREKERKEIGEQTSKPANMDRKP